MIAFKYYYKDKWFLYGKKEKEKEQNKQKKKKKKEVDAAVNQKTRKSKNS